MEFDTQRKIQMTVGVIVVILLIVAGIIVWRKRTGAIAPSVAGTNAEPSAAAVLTPNTDVGPTVPQVPIPTGSVPSDSADAQMQRTTMDFVARFGTYSTDAQNENLQQLLSRMGPTLRAWATTRIHTASATVSFQGVTTHPISAKISAQTAGTATVQVGTQRLYRDASGATKTTYEIATASLIKSGQTWLVDAVSWKAYNPQ